MLNIEKNMGSSEVYPISSNEKELEVGSVDSFLKMYPQNSEEYKFLDMHGFNNIGFQPELMKHITNEDDQKKILVVINKYLGRSEADSVEKRNLAKLIADTAERMTSN